MIINIIDYWSRDLLNFDFFLKKSLGIVFPPHFVYNFFRKLFLMLYSINSQNFIVWFSLLLEIFFSMCIAIVCLQVATWELTSSFQWSRFSTWRKSQEKIVNILRTKRAFNVKTGIFHHFLRAFSCQNVSDLRVHLYEE